MSRYTPDLWEIVRLSINDEQINKILASWYGGFAGSDEWRLSSGIVEVVENDSHYQIHNESGSVYLCPKGAKGMSIYTSRVFNQLQEDFAAGGGSLEIIDINDIINV
jgi:hypothetical protein